MSEKKCVPCEGGTKPLSQEAARDYLRQLRLKWELVGTTMIRRQFIFNDFSEAMVFVNDVAAIAEDEDHHPDLCISFKRVTIELTTHAIKGLSENDFIVARKIELCL